MNTVLRMLFVVALGVVLAIGMNTCAQAVEIEQFGKPGVASVLDVARCVQSLDTSKAPDFKQIRRCYDLLPPRAAQISFDNDYGPNRNATPTAIIIVVH